MAFSDVSRAFEVFLEKTEGQPFFVAGHSQGSMLGIRLVRERIAGKVAQHRFIGAYLPGAAAGADELRVPVCDTPRRTGCVAVWNARGPAFVPNGFEFNAKDENTMRGRVCVNPISWRADSEQAMAKENPGAVFFDTEKPVLRPNFADARCQDGTLIVREPGDLERDFMGKTLLWLMGPENYHPVEYQLFYASLRANGVERLRAFEQARGSADVRTSD